MRSEQEVAVARARHAVTEVELRTLQVAADKKSPVEKELQTARESLAKAMGRLQDPVGTNASFTPLAGARWTPTRFLSSTADDPTVVFQPESTGRRKALAGWITDPRHPLTARVAVNLIWERHMGTPLVAAVFDFGRKGAVPAQLELID